MEKQDKPLPEGDQPQVHAGNAPDSGDKHVPYERFKAVVEQRKAAEQTLEDLAKELAEEIPESMRSLIPAALPAAERIKWLRTAQKSGVFAGGQPSGPDAKKPGGKPSVDFDNMSPQALRSMGYKT